MRVLLPSSFLLVLAVSLWHGMDKAVYGHRTGKKSRTKNIVTGVHHMMPSTALLQTTHSRVSVFSVDASKTSVKDIAPDETKNSFLRLFKFPRADQSLADINQEAFQASPDGAASSSHQRMTDNCQQADSKRMPCPKHYRAERTMADLFQNPLSVERDPRITIQAASPTMLRVSYWVVGLLFSGVTSLALFGLTSSRGARLRRHKPGVSRLVVQRIDVSSVPPETVCAVCLEGADEVSQPKQDVECGADGSETLHNERSAQTQLSEARASEWCQTPCGHCFHRTCIERWLSTATPARKRCPLCNWS